MIEVEGGKPEDFSGRYINAVLTLGKKWMIRILTKMKAPMVKDKPKKKIKQKIKKIQA